MEMPDDRSDVGPRNRPSVNKSLQPSPARCRRTVVALHDRFRVSERLACRVVGQHRSGQCHPSNVILIEETKLQK